MRAASTSGVRADTVGKSETMMSRAFIVLSPKKRGAARASNPGTLVYERENIVTGDTGDPDRFVTGMAAGDNRDARFGNAETLGQKLDAEPVGGVFNRRRGKPHLQCISLQAAYLIAGGAGLDLHG